MGGTAFLRGGGRATALIEARDWTDHPLGTPGDWPEGLKTALSLVVNSPESMILCWGPDLHFFFNETYIPLLGPRVDWAMGARFEEVWADALEQAMPIVREAFAGHSRRFEDLPWKLATDRGSADTWWTFSYSRILGADGEVAGLFIFTNETTKKVLADQALVESQQALIQANASLEARVEEAVGELRATEASLRQAQKMEAVGHLTGGIAHDFNNMLAGVSGALDLIESRLANGRPQEVERFTGIARGAVDRAAALTHRLLAFSRQQALDPRPTDANALIIEMADLVQRTVGPSVVLEIAPSDDLWTILVDTNQLENTLLNLCINARDAMPGGGRIEIATRNHTISTTDAADEGLSPGAYVLLAVTDAGGGMSPEVVAQAFDPFFTTKPMGEGTGLGLSMVYGFAQQSGGQARIVSEVGRGTTVVLELPRFEGEPSRREPILMKAELRRAPSGKTVLLVDDEPSLRAVAAEVLEEMGLSVVEASDSLSGLRILQSNVPIDLLITDVELPGGMNGHEMAQAGRLARPGLRVLYITGYAETALGDADGRLEADTALMTKPFALDAFADRVQVMLSAAPSGD